MQWNFELVAGPFGGTTEGPVWDGEALLFSHIPASRIMRFDPKTGGCSEFRTGTEETNGLMFDSRGRLYGCRAAESCIARYETDGSVTRLPNRLDGRRINRPNDLAIDRKGRIWFTDPYGRVPPEKRELDHASVLRLDPKPDGDWTLCRVTMDTGSPNGILISPNERTLYVAESGYKTEGVRELRAYPIRDDGVLEAYRVLHTFGSDHRGVHRGIDGMCMDVEGNIIACAGWRAAGPGPMVYIFAPSGRILETHAIPTDKPTNCTFGDADLSTLYVTTAGGHLYRVPSTGQRGLLAYPQ